jgi:5-methyltetrahydropteroyltriglutamate--homocysteine methyltransferase
MVSAIVLNEHYPSEETFLDALGEALRFEYETIIAGGFLLQLDCPDLARERHNTYQDRPLDDFLAFGNHVIDAINRALRNIPRERVRMHVCWGNYEGPHDCDVGLEDIIPVIARAKVWAKLKAMSDGARLASHACFDGVNEGRQHAGREVQEQPSGRKVNV